MLRIYIAHLLALFLSAAGIVAVEAAFSLSIAHLSISRHYFVLKIEVSVIVGSRVSIHNYQMLCSTQAHEVGYTPTYISSSDWFIVEYHFVLRRDAKCERVLLRHILRPVRLLFLVERWQLAHKSAVHIHRRGDEEECEQHERNVGCGCRVKRRYRVFSAFYQHLVIMFYKPN